MNNNLIPNMDAKTKEAVIRMLLVAQGITPTTDDEICFKSMRLLASATDKIARLTLDKPQKEIPLADIEIGERYSISDLPDLVATKIAQPFGSLGDDWASFAQKAEYSMRGKLSRCAMRKLGHAAERLELALGCLKWADIVGVHDIPQFQAAFTSALILDKDATTELNGETIDIKPEATKMPFDKSVWMQILDGVKSLIAGQAEIKAEQGELSKSIAAAIEKLKPDLEQPDLLDGIEPETNQKDAITYCARLVDYVWANLPRKTKTKSLDYVFRGAKEGDRLFKDCKAARTYQQLYSFAESSVQTQAAQLHAKRTTSTNKTQAAGSWGERPERWNDAVEQSRCEEEKTIKAEHASKRKQKRPRR